METNVNYTIVGAFVIILISAMVLTIVWLSSGFSFEQNTNYMVYMRESVSGLNVDSSVEYNGVEVGGVKSIQINRQDPQVVEILLSIKNTTPITEGTVATLSSKGITGIGYIALKDKGMDTRPLVAQPGQLYPVIKTAPSFFVRLDTALNKLSENLSNLSASVQSLLNKQNQQTIRQTLLNLEEMTNHLAANSKKLEPLVQSSSEAMRMLETQTLPEAYRLMYNLNDMSRSLTEMTNEIKQNPSILVRGTAPQPLGPGETR
ncbi:MAG: MCE family protein [Gammaproteobacteria bacterium]|nr:MAG: MCE family protein [Gammaproteobacteria bacterium]